MQFLCHFLSVFMVTWSQNEPSEGRQKVPSWQVLYGEWQDFVFMASGLNLTQLMIKSLWVALRWLILTPGHNEKCYKVTQKVRISQT